MHKRWMWKQRSYREQFEGTEGGNAVGGSATPDDQAQDDQQAEGETPGAEQPSDQVDQHADDELVVTIGDETPPAVAEEGLDGRPAPQWLKDLRKRDKEQAKKIRELEQERTAREATVAPKAEDVGPEPDLEDADINFDKDLFKQKWTAWNDRKKKADEQAAAARTEQEAAQAAWTAKQAAYNTAKAALKVADFDGAEHIVRETLNQVQQSIILSGADKPELLVYALGRSPTKAKELAAIKDPVRFAFAVAKLETQLKVAPRNTPPAPERAVRGTAGGATAVDSTEARLEKEADETGNRTKLIQYRKDKAAKAVKAA